MDGINILDLHKLCENKFVKWTAHILMRLQERGINPSDIKNCVLTGEIIEQYPTDYPYPSCLISGSSISGKSLHVVIGVGNGYLWGVTAYYPDLDKWEADLKTRKEF